MPTGSVFSYLWLLMGMGALSLLTPCVFPMIPITVSYFADHSSLTRTGAIRKAAVYGVGIMLTFVVLGVWVTMIVHRALCGWQADSAMLPSILVKQPLLLQRRRVLGRDASLLR